MLRFVALMFHHIWKVPHVDWLEFEVVKGQQVTLYCNCYAPSQLLPCSICPMLCQKSFIPRSITAKLVLLS